LAAPFFQDGEDDQTFRTGVRLWDVATGKEVLRVGGPLKGGDVPSQVPYPAFSPDGKVLARGAPDGTSRLRDTSDGKEKRSLGGAAKGGRAQYDAGTRATAITGGVVFSPDGKALAATLSDGRVLLYDAGTGKKLHSFAEGPPRRPGVLDGRAPLDPVEY